MRKNAPQRLDDKDSICGSGPGPAFDLSLMVLALVDGAMARDRLAAFPESPQQRHLISATT